MSVEGADRVRRKLDKLKDRVAQAMSDANQRNGEDILRVAKILVPVGADVEGDGHERGKITGERRADGSYLLDFGPKSRVIEGDRGPRPFVNPALSVTRKRRASRARRAINKAVKESFHG